MNWFKLPHLILHRAAPPWSLARWSWWSTVGYYMMMHLVSGSHSTRHSTVLGWWPEESTTSCTGTHRNVLLYRQTSLYAWWVVILSHSFIHLFIGSICQVACVCDQIWEKILEEKPHKKNLAKFSNENALCDLSIRRPLVQAQAGPTKPALPIVQWLLYKYANLIVYTMFNNAGMIRR